VGCPKKNIKKKIGMSDDVSALLLDHMPSVTRNRPSAFGGGGGGGGSSGGGSEKMFSNFKEGSSLLGVDSRSSSPFGGAGTHLLEKSFPNSERTPLAVPGYAGSGTGFEDPPSSDILPWNNYYQQQQLQQQQLQQQQLQQQQMQQQQQHMQQVYAWDMQEYRVIAETSPIRDDLKQLVLILCQMPFHQPVGDVGMYSFTSYSNINVVAHIIEEIFNARDRCVRTQCMSLASFDAITGLASMSRILDDVLRTNRPDRSVLTCQTVMEEIRERVLEHLRYEDPHFDLSILRGPKGTLPFTRMRNGQSPYVEQASSYTMSSTRSSSSSSSSSQNGMKRRGRKTNAEQQTQFGTTSSTHQHQALPLDYRFILAMGLCFTFFLFVFLNM